MNNLHYYLSFLIPFLLYSDEVKLRIDEDGKVGVGVTNPSTKLDIDGSVTVGSIGATESPKAGTIKFENGDFLGFDGTTWRSLTQGTSSSSENLNIDEDGKVGVGVTNPSTKLDIDGSVTVGSIGATESPKAGTIKFENGDFLGFDGTTWRSMTQGNSSSSENNTSTSTDTSGSLLALPAASTAPSGYSFIQALDKQFSWQKLADRNFKSLGGKLEKLNQKLYYIGGYDSVANFEDFGSTTSPQPCEKYDPSSNQWSVIQSPSFPRIYSATVAYEDRIYLLPGKDRGGLSRGIEVYDPEKNLWSHGTALPNNYEIGYTNAGVVIDGKIFCSAWGTTPETTGSDSNRVILTYDIQTGIWSSFVRTEQDDFGSLTNITPEGWTFVEDGKFSVISTYDGYVQSYSPDSSQWSWGIYTSIDSIKFSNIFGKINNRIIIGSVGMISVFDFRTGYTRNYTLNGLINDSFQIDGATAVILDNELYVCSTPGPEISDGFIKSSLDNFLDLYVKD